MESDGFGRFSVSAFSEDEWVEEDEGDFALSDSDDDDSDDELGF